MTGTASEFESDQAVVKLIGLLGAICYHCITMYNKSIYMKTEMLSTRIDHDTKLAFTHVCDEIGLSPSQAIKLFAKAVINYGGIPFELRTKTPNSKTLEAIQELEVNKM